MATSSPSSSPAAAPLPPEEPKLSEGSVERFQTKPEDAGNETIEGRLARLEEEDIQEKLLKPVKQELQRRLGRSTTRKEIQDYLTKIEIEIRDAFQREKGWHAIDLVAFNILGAEYGINVRTVYGSPGENGKYKIVRRDIDLSSLRRRTTQKPTDSSGKFSSDAETFGAKLKEELMGASDKLAEARKISLEDLRKWGDEIPGTPEGGHFLGLFDELPASPDYYGDIKGLRANIQAIDDAAAKLHYDFVQSPHAFRERARDLLHTLPDHEVIMEEVAHYQGGDSSDEDTSLMGNISKLYMIIVNLVQAEGIPDEWPTS